MNLDSNNVNSEHLGHLGLIAAVTHELGIIDKLNTRLPLAKHKGGQVSHGHRAAAMILNGLGFMNSRLYMTSQFFNDKPVAQLLGADIQAAQLNDDCLGRCLDAIAGYGTTQLYSEIAFEIASEQNVLGQRLHLDTTSLTLYGRYESAEETALSPQPARGYSKAHRADLKQVMLSLTMGGAANLPLWMEALDGNSSDKKSFQQTARQVQQFTQQMQHVPEGLCFIVDAEFYVPQRLAELEGIHWITRVPGTFKEAKALLRKADVNWQALNADYALSSQGMKVGGIEQRWVLVRSQPAYEREVETLHRWMEKHGEALSKALWHVSCNVFACETDAVRAVKALIKKLPYHGVLYEVVPQWQYLGRGKPKAGATREIVGYQIVYSVFTDLNKVEAIQRTLGRFILATNQLDDKVLPDSEVLSQYKGQACVEGGFKFIKNDAFELDSIFLKTPARIGALMMIMTLCLMVYNFAQYQLRKALKEHDDVLPNQLGKAVKNPTLKWVAELMHVIVIVTVSLGQTKQHIVTNVNQVHRKIIGYFGKFALQIYGLPEDYQQVKINYANYKNLLQWCEM
jgi:transposase